MLQLFFSSLEDSLHANDIFSNGIQKNKGLEDLFYK